MEYKKGFLTGEQDGGHVLAVIVVSRVRAGAGHRLNDPVFYIDFNVIVFRSQDDSCYLRVCNFEILDGGIAVILCSAMQYMRFK